MSEAMFPLPYISVWHAEGQFYVCHYLYR